MNIILNIIQSAMMPKGMHGLCRDGQLVWLGPLGAPIEDAECDTIMVSPADYEWIKNETSPR